MLLFGSPTSVCLFVCSLYNRAHDKDIKEANKEREYLCLLQQQQVMENLTLQVLFQQSRYPPLAQHSTVFPQFHYRPIQDLCSVYRSSLQAPQPSDLASGNTDNSLHSYFTLQARFQPILQTVSIQRPITMQVPVSTEPQHCLPLTCGSNYFSGHHSCVAGCFDG